MDWHLLSSTIPNSLDELNQILLKNRGLDSISTQVFFSPQHPLDLSLEDVQIDRAQMEKTIERLKIAKEKKEDVVVFGDYDADGVCATAILWETLYEWGVKARPFIPHREKHGYGMTDRSLKDLLAEKVPDIVITVDTGIVALEAVEQLNKLGVEVIITDHHVPENGKTGKRENGKIETTKQPKANQFSDSPIFPNAFSIIHSTKLCGATVAWFVAREINREKAGTLLDLCGIATIADQMILQGANRSFASFGLEALRKSERVGIQNLCKVANVEQAEISETTVNYMLAPRLNAMGRIASAMDALKALCTKNPAKSWEIMQVLQTTNQERQELTNTVIEEVIAQAEAWKDEHIIVVASEDYHEGVIGLIAGKLVEKFYKPAIAISINQKSAKGSARSVDGVNVVELIRQVRDDLLEVGGHPMAAGFSVLPENIEIVKKRLQTLAKDNIQKSLLKPSITVDCVLPTEFVNVDTLVSIQQFRPFGNGNPEPVFGLKNVQIEQVYAVGRERQHLKLVVSCQLPVISGQDFKSTLHVGEKLNFDAIGFNLGHLENELQSGMTVNLAGKIGLNEWNGRQKVQVVVKDVVKTK